MLDSAIATIASCQCGLFSRQQALNAGGYDELILRRLTAGRWLQMAPGVYSLPGFADSWHRRLWLAHLDAGPQSVVSHEAAAALHGLLYFKPGPVVLLTTHGDHHRPVPKQAPGRPIVRQSRDLRPQHVTHIAGLPVTTIPRTFCDLAASCSRGRIERAVDDAHLTKRCTIADITALAADLCRPGKRGLPWLLQALGERGPGAAIPESQLERMLHKVLREGGFKFKAQHELPWRRDVPNRVDVLLDDRIIVEADGRRWHGRVDSMAEDRRRDRDALNHGHPVYRFLYEEVKHDKAQIWETLRGAKAALAQRAA